MSFQPRAPPPRRAPIAFFIYVLGSWRIARLFGIDVRIHWTFLLLLAFVANRGATTFLLVVLAAFGSVLLHELGHCLVARRFGVNVMDITFWPLGGMARMTQIPETPRVEGLIAIAGPAVNFVLAALTAVVMVAIPVLGGPAWAFNASLGFLGINLMLGVFNLVPAFPMDGGRILRAFLARKYDYVRATEIAVRAGRVVALGMILVALGLSLVDVNALCIMPLIAVFIWFAGGRELLAVRLRHGRSPFGDKFGGAMFGGDRFGGGAERDADADAAPAYEVETEPRPEAPHGHGPRRPAAWDPEAPRQPQRGFSEETLRRLERYPGRLPRRGDRDLD